LLPAGNEVKYLDDHLSSLLTKKYVLESRPEQLFKRYKLLADSKVHLFQFSQVDTTMRIAEEFEPKLAYTRALSDIYESSIEPVCGAALAF